MAHYRIKKGYDIPVKGKAERRLSELPAPPFVGVHPTSFAGVKPKLKVAVDDRVKVGTPLFFDKNHPEIMFCSPGSGKISAIDYGPRRVIERIVIACDDQTLFDSKPVHDTQEIASMQRDDLIAELLAGGVWPFIRQRPFDKIADPSLTPKSIFVNFMDTAPLAADQEFALEGRENEFAAGLTAMKVLSGGKLFVIGARDLSKSFKSYTEAEYHSFSGPHPAGLVSTHIGRLDPINQGQWIWYVNARDVVAIGHFLLTGHYPIERVVAIAGSGASDRAYVKTQLGAQIQNLVGDSGDSGSLRYISGNLLTGTVSSPDRFLELYDAQVTVIAEGDERHFLGWIMPGLSKWSFGRTMLSSFMPGKRFEMDTNLNGGPRAIVQSGLWERVVALDIHPEFLIKAAVANDIEGMEKLGIFEVAPEDFALCSYVCPSKTEVCEIIRDGLDLMEQEG